MPMIPRWTMLAMVAVSASALGLAACEKAANLDVTYGGDASADSDAAPSPGVEFEACPCDESAGLGCCVPKGGGTPYCTESTALCAADQGIHLKCFRPDSLTESVCCWHGVGGASASGAVTALAGTCDGGAPACATDADCAGTGKTCQLAHCGPDKLAFGICADNALPCP